MQTELIKQERTAIWQAGYCVVCGDEITGTAEHVCKSRFCFAKWNNWTRIKDRWHELHRECQWCGKTFRVHCKPKETNPQKFCSNECSGPGAIWGTPQSMRMRLLIRSVRARREAAVRQRGKRCVICGEYTNTGMRADTCEGECRTEYARREAIKYELAKYERDGRRIEMQCVECGAKWISEYGDKRKKYCSVRCNRRSTKRKTGTRSHRGRCKKFGVPYSYGVTRRKVMQRSGWRCGICGGAIDRRLSWPHTRYGTIDHIIPLAVAGSPGHVLSNVQAAHWDCNIDKGAGVADSDQLLLL